ncbi:hypothetical protein [Dyadobacter sandarakinus]|uniref:Type 1 periplasmic binding fold superfamily protein n=1 Tax=Dyadobacter sandarakinus TaxID=2747268 RepID=A0ABX7IC42_9BACT|nr:hypothetical protein [Dyadobacter sandarakinus]QRR03509.1 hypothetical protein HWI92_22630 [Dyadobacter sandarakinus]
MKMNRKWGWPVMLGLSILFAQCKDSGEDLEPDDENELITSVTLKFTEAGTNTVTSFSYKDADGDGGNAPTAFDTIALKPNASYTLTAAFLDESKNPVENITEEIAEKANEHLLVYTPAPSSLLIYTYGDKDANNYPIGLTGTVKTGAAGAGTLKVQLRHQPGTKNGTTSPGSDDVNLDFNLKIR